MKYFILFLIYICLRHDIHGQECYSLFTQLKQDPSNHQILTEILTACDHHGGIEQLILFKSYIALKMIPSVKKSMMYLLKNDIDEEDLSTMISDSLWAILNKDYNFTNKFTQIKNERRLILENDTISKIIKASYDLDQSVRKFAKTTNEFNTLTFVDSCILNTFEILFSKNKISGEKIGMNNEKYLYLCLLHEMRDVSEETFGIWNERLLRLVTTQQFNPYYYANIVDERLRVQKGPDYPKYNFLRSAEVSPSQQLIIEMNRRKINAY